jgi:hypothetical protein
VSHKHQIEPKYSEEVERRSPPGVTTLTRAFFILAIPICWTIFHEQNRLVHLQNKGLALKELQSW